MKKLTAIALGLSLSATALAGAAYAQNTGRDAPQTRAQAQTRSAEMFARMDVNKDGKIDQADREARRAAHFDRLDTDKNGQLSRAEFSARPQRGPQGEGPRAQGERPDGKHHAMRGHRGGRGGMRGPGMMGADANKDGAVTQAEFSAAALQRFDRLDANKDGQVTKEERQAARQQMREEWRKARADRAAQTAPATK